MSAADSSPPAPRKAKWYDTTISGAASGFAATYAKQPVQRLKWIRQVDPGVPVPYREVLRRTLERDGVRGLFRGSLAAISRNVPHSAIVYTIFPHFEQLVIDQKARRYPIPVRIPIRIPIRMRFPLRVPTAIAIDIPEHPVMFALALTLALALGGYPDPQPQPQPQPLSLSHPQPPAPRPQASASEPPPPP